MIFNFSPKDFNMAASPLSGSPFTGNSPITGDIAIPTTTVPIRFLHLYRDLVDTFGERKYPGDFQYFDPYLKNKKILLIGPGGSRVTEPYPSNKKVLCSPQISEIMTLLSSSQPAAPTERSFLHVMDINHDLIDTLKNGLFVVIDQLAGKTFSKFDQEEEAAFHHFFNEKLIQMQQEKLYNFPIMTHSLCNLAKEPPPSEEYAKYDSIISTNSLHYYTEGEEFKQALSSSIQLLNHEGVLYFTTDEENFECLYSTLPLIERETQSSLSLTKIAPPIETYTDTIQDHISSFAKMQNLPEKLVIIRSMATITKRDTSPEHEELYSKLNIKVGDCIDKLADAMPTLAPLTTCTEPLFRIVRKINPLIHLASYETKSTKKSYWLHVAKHTKTEGTFKKFASMIATLGEESFQMVSEEHHWTPLHIAVLARSPHAITFFKNHGVNPDALDYQGKTAADYARLCYPEGLTLLASSSTGAVSSGQ